MASEHGREGGRVGVPKMIYTFGDSHAWHCWLKIKNTMPFSPGPMTLYHFGFYKPVMTSKVPLEDVVVFSYGEIDCRCQIHKFPPWEETIDKLVENYKLALDANAVGRDPKRVWVNYVVPPPRRDGLPHVEAENPDYPFLGSDQERLSFVRRMNDGLKKLPYTYIDLYDQYADKDGFLNPAMSDDQCHVSDPKPLQEWVNAHT